MPWQREVMRERGGGEEGARLGEMQGGIHVLGPPTVGRAGRV